MPQKPNTLNLRVSKALYKEITRVAHDNGLPKSDVAREVLERHFLKPTTLIVGEVVSHPELGNVIKFYDQPGQPLRDVVSAAGGLIVTPMEEAA